MQAYLDLLKQVLAEGVHKPTGAVLPSTGKNAHAISLFAPQIRFDLQVGFPAVTTKRLFFRGVVAELLWFLSGSTNVQDLQRQGVHIWDQWADEFGDVGPTYGQVWRDFGIPGTDQIAKIVGQIRAVKANPFDRSARRIILTAWDPTMVDNCALPPCHVMAQWVLTQGKLSCHLLMRSTDLFIGAPFNIASYALLTHLFAQVCEVDVGTLACTFVDCHLYENHLDQVAEQLRREPLPPPRLWLNPSVRRMEGFTVEDAKLLDYQHHPALPGEVAV